MPKPIPVADEVSKPFWDAVNQRKLALQYCKTDKLLQYPPRRTCNKCGSADSLEWREVKGRGHIMEYTVVRDWRVRRLQPDQPYNLAVITLDEDTGINFLSHLPGTPVGQVPVGAPVELVFEEVAPGQLIHEWRVVS